MEQVHGVELWDQNGGDGFDVTAAAIWGGDHKSKVYATAYRKGLRIIFSFLTDDTLRYSTSSRIVTSHHELPVRLPDETFPDDDSRREAVWSSIRWVWADCARDPAIKWPDVVVEIY